MYNNEEFFEVRDYDEDIKSRQELLEEAKKLQEREGDVDLREVSGLKKRWRRIAYWESAFEDKLEEEFDAILDVFYGKRREEYKKNEAVKEELIAQASAITAPEDYKKATDQMNELMEKWKEAGSAGKDVDDALWERFNAARQKFYDNKHEHWETMKDKFEKAKTIKEELIEKAAALEDSEEWKKTAEKFKELMDAWKEAGSAGRAHEDALWEKFNASRQKFYDKRNAYYDALHATQDEHLTKKQALVEKAREIEAAKEYSRANTEQMKQMSVQWKEIGSCRRDEENKIWAEFREIMDAYFDGLRNWNDQRKENWRQNRLDARKRKQDTIVEQKRQIKYMEEEMVGLLGERAIADMAERIEDKKDFIAQLEAEIADIDKSLEE